jgi:tRNA(Ile)-lysidine synthase
MSATPLSASEARAAFERLSRYRKLALAVSGGPDSLALMQLAAQWRGARGSGPELHVLTVDHGLRAASRDEALMVGCMAATLGLRHAILTWEGQVVGRNALQARARAARYDLMADYCHANDIPALATAHTLDDQAETFLMRLKRGSGLDGLAAIPLTGAWSGVVLERPLLDVPKARLIATLEARSIGFASDPSNSDMRFERTRVRGSKSALATLGLTQKALALSARRLRRAREALDHAASSFLAASSETSDAGYAVVDADALASAPQEIALRALARLIASVGGGEEPLRLAKLEALLASLAANPDKTHTLGRCRVEPLAGQLGIFREMRAAGLPVIELRPGMRALWDNRFRIELGASEAGPVTVRALGDRGFIEMRDSLALPASLPRLAGRVLPACFRGDVLAGIPLFGAASPHSDLDCRARFVSAGWHGERRSVLTVEEACTSLR